MTTENEPSADSKRHPGKSRVLWLLILILTAFVVGGLLTPAGHEPPEWMRRSMCKQNLHQIASALKMYRDDNDGQFPPSIDYLVTGKYHAHYMSYVCPSYRKAHEREIARVRKNSPAELLETSYRYIHPPQAEGGMTIVVKEILEHAAVSRKSLTAGRHVITHELEVIFVPSKDAGPKK